MPLNVQPNPLAAAVAFVRAQAAVSYVDAVAAVTYTRLRADVLVIGEGIGAAFTDSELMLDALAFQVRKGLSDSEAMTDAVTVAFFSGSELDGAELNGVVMNG